MLPFNMGYYGNPHSSSHAYGWQAEAAVEHARKQVAQLIGAEPRNRVYFRVKNLAQNRKILTDFDHF